ncbi:MAG: thiamine diphosphokinase [Proteobacteria bacterium]|jgi:thiamine pyrophosphokinase|nr:thiamine diphosphokinase [Pseudomonadota bacterium]
MTLKNILEQIYPTKQYNVIIADGRFPKDPHLHHLIENSATTIACDGAVNKLLKHNMMPNYIIGDCDSISLKHYKQFEDRIIKIADQNHNDLTKAVNLAVEKKLDNIIILGATGIREDHTIANIALLIKYQTKINNIAIISDYGIFTACINPIEELPTIVGQQISLFTTNHDTIITCNELKWPLANYQFKSWENGTLNQASNNHIKISCNNPVIIYRAFCIKN